MYSLKVIFFNESNPGGFKYATGVDNKFEYGNRDFDVIRMGTRPPTSFLLNISDYKKSIASLLK